MYTQRLIFDLIEKIHKMNEVQGGITILTELRFRYEPLNIILYILGIYFLIHEKFVLILTNNETIIDTEACDSLIALILMNIKFSNYFFLMFIQKIKFIVFEQRNPHNFLHLFSIVCVRRIHLFRKDFHEAQVFHPIFVLIQRLPDN